MDILNSDKKPTNTFAVSLRIFSLNSTVSALSQYIVEKFLCERRHLALITIMCMSAFLGLEAFGQTGKYKNLDSLLEKSSEWLDIQIDSAESIALEAVSLAEKLDDHNKRLLAIERLGQVELRRGNFSACQSYMDEIFDACAQRECDPIVLALGHNTLGGFYYMTGDMLQAGEQFMSAVDFYNASGDSLKAVSMKLNVATVLLHTGGKEKAFDLLVNIVGDDISTPEIKARAYNNMGLIKSSQSKLSEAIAFFEKAIALSDDQPLLMKQLQINLAIAYEESERYNEALKSYEKLEDFYSASGDVRLLNKVKIGIANCYAALGQGSQALKYLAEAEETIVDKETQILDYIDVLEVKHQVYAKMGDFSKAYATIDDYYRLLIHNQHNGSRERFMELQTQYETEQKEMENEQLKIKNELQNDVIASQRNLLLTVAFGLLLFIVLSVYIYRQSKIKDKLNKELSERNHKIELLHRELRHRVNNNLAFISSLMQIQSRRLKNTEAIEALYESESRVRAMSLLHRKLQLDADDSTDISLKDYLKEVVSHLEQSFPFDRQPPEIILTSDEVMIDAESAIRIGLIVNELVTNAFKHAFTEQSDGLIKIKVDDLKGEKILLSYRDNGSGLPADFEIDKSDSMGVKLIQSLANLLNAKPKFMSDQGTVFELEISPTPVY